MNDGLSALGIAGVNMRQLAEAAIQGVVTPQSGWARRHVMAGLREHRPRRVVYLTSFNYLICTDRHGGYRWRQGFAELFAPGRRIMPLVLDSAAPARYARDVLGRNTCERWVSYEAYLAAIEITQPDMWMSYDVLGRSDLSYQYWRRMIAEGYGARLIPVWQAPSVFDRRLDVRIPGSHKLTPEQRVMIANAAWAARHDPYLKAMCSSSRLVAIGGLLHSSIPKTARHLYLVELARQFPDNQFWALGLARPSVVNGLVQYGVLDRIWTDGTWWLKNAQNDVIPWVEDGIIKTLPLGELAMAIRRKRGLPSSSPPPVFSFFELKDLMKANIRALHILYLGLVEFPAPLPYPFDPTDSDHLEIYLNNIRRKEVDP